MAKRALFGALLLVFAVAGCSNDGKYITGPDAIVWQNDPMQPAGRFSVRGHPKMTGQVSDLGGFVQVSLWGFPKGLELQVGDRQATVDEQGSAQVSYDATALFGKLPADSLDKLAAMQPLTLDHGLSMVLTPKGRAPVSVPLPPMDVSEDSITTIFERAVTQKGLRFGSEPAGHAGPPRSVISVSPMARKVLGTARTLGDIDAVALTKMLPEVKGTKTCGGFRDDNGRAVPPVQIQLQDSEVSIYDRRTGALLETRRFPPLDKCPSSVMLLGNSSSTHSWAPREAIFAWLSAWASGQRPAAQEAVQVAPTP